MTFASLTRISDLDQRPFDQASLPRQAWATGDYVVGEVTKGFGFQPDLVTGVCTSTSAGVTVIRGLVDAAALNLTNPQSFDDLDKLLVDRLKIRARPS